MYASEDAYVLRRQFTKFLVLTSAGMMTGNALIFARSLMRGEAAALPRMAVARASEIAPGTVRLFNYPGPHDPCILVRRTDGTLAAFSQKCTHLSCAVYYSAAHDRLECPCHEGYFSPVDGRVLQGPPPRALPQIRLEEEGGQIVAAGYLGSEP